MAEPIHQKVSSSGMAQEVSVLLIEDNEIDGERVKRILESVPNFHYQTEHVTNLANAYQCLFQDDFDVILLDLCLPDGSSLDILKRLVEVISIPVIVLTGGGGHSLAIDILKMGAHDFLEKSANLESTIHQSLQFAITRHETLFARAKLEGMRLAESEIHRQLGSQTGTDGNTATHLTPQYAGGIQ